MPQSKHLLHEGRENATNGYYITLILLTTQQTVPWQVSYLQHSPNPPSEILSLDITTTVQSFDTILYVFLIFILFYFLSMNEQMS